MHALLNETFYCAGASFQRFPPRNGWCYTEASRRQRLQTIAEEGIKRTTINISLDSWSSKTTTKVTQSIPHLWYIQVELEFDEKQMKCLLIVGLWCVQARQCAEQAIQVLNFEVPLSFSHKKCPWLATVVSFSFVSGNTSDLEIKRSNRVLRLQTYTNASEFTTTSVSNSSPSASLLHN